MKVDSTPAQKLNTPSRVKKPDIKRRSDSFLAEVEGPTYTPSLRETPPASSEISDILQLQEVTQPLFSLKRSRARGEEILKVLDKIRHSLLGGGLEKSAMIRLRKSLEATPISSQDPRLNEIVQEIEQRLAIELAKMEVAENERERR